MARPAILLAALTFCLPITVVAQTTPAVQSTSPAVFSATTHDFGDVKHGSVMSHTFTVRNEGQADLKIAEVDLQAPGMKTSFKPTIGAGETVRLTIEWNSAQLRGPVVGKVVVRFAADVQPPVTLELKANVTRPIDILPMPAVFFSLYKGDTATRSVTVVNGEPMPLEISSLEPAGSHFIAKVHPVEPGQKYRVDVTVPSTTEPGRFMEKLFLHTNHPTRKRLEIGVNVLVKNDLYVNPEMVELGEIKTAELAANPQLVGLLDQKLIVRKKAGEFRITSVTTDVPGLHVSTASSSPAQAFQIDVSVQPEKLVPGKLSGTIRIATDDKSFPVLQVPVAGLVR